MITIVVVITVFLSYYGYDYYKTPLEERFYHPRNNWFKPNGIFGHGLGIIGTSLIFMGVFLYILRKRYGFLSRYLRLKYMLEFHIFLCILGPVLILFHTAFKFGGIVSVAFWSMVIVVLSGVIGRYIYIQIPRTIEGRELTLSEVKAGQIEGLEHLKTKFNLDENLINSLSQMINERQKNAEYINELKRRIKSLNLSGKDKKDALKLIRREMSLSRKIGRLELMQKLFRYWHAAHLPFAIIMLIILIIHVGVALALGYTWIF